MSQEAIGSKGFVAGEALATCRRVRLHASTAGVVVYSDADEECQGVTAGAAANAEHVTVNFLGGRTHRCTASGAISANADIYSAADGKVSASGAGSGSAVVGKALEAALADGDIIECIFNATVAS